MERFRRCCLARRRKSAADRCSFLVADRALAAQLPARHV
jgi:hypothetical protein